MISKFLYGESFQKIKDGSVCLETSYDVLEQQNMIYLLKEI